MNRMKKLMGSMATAAAMAMLIPASAFADSRPQNVTGSWNDPYRDAVRNVRNDRDRDDRYRDDRYRDDRYRDDRRDDRRRSRDRDYISGYVERIDHRRDVLVLREGRGGRRVTVVMPRGDRRRGVDLNDLRRGDYVELTGDWERNGLFEAWRIDNVRSRR